MQENTGQQITNWDITTKICQQANIGNGLSQIFEWLLPTINMWDSQNFDAFITALDLSDTKELIKHKDFLLKVYSQVKENVHWRAGIRYEYLFSILNEYA